MGRCEGGVALALGGCTGLSRVKGGGHKWASLTQNLTS